VTIPWRRRDDGADSPDKVPAEPADGGEDWDDDWDDDWDEAPWGDTGIDPGKESEARPAGRRLAGVAAKGKEVASEIPLGAMVVLAVLLILGVVLGPQTGATITNLVSPARSEASQPDPPDVDAVAGEGAGGRPEGGRPPVAVERPPGAPVLPEGSGLAALASAPVQEVAPFDGGGYDRSAFPHWADPDGNGCDARQDTLIRDFDGATVSDCTVASGTGTLVSVWDREELTDPSDADVDHVVALAWAHASGAAEWPADDPRRQQLANDPANLVAVTAASNRAKGALGPDRWQPEDPTAACLYANRFVRVVVAYELVLTEAEHGSLEAILTGCE
jgi:hypothetical protein